MMQTILPHTFYARDTVIVARELLGKIIVRTIDGMVQKGIIVETEAYRSSDDPACHAFRGKTARTAPLFGPVGHLYVYFIYGNHFCMNIVAKDTHTPAGGVLIRAINLVEDDNKLCTDGPGKLTRALGITKNENNLNVTIEGPLFVTEGIKVPSDEIISSSRIGISVAQDKQWRFYIKI